MEKKLFTRLLNLRHIASLIGFTKKCHRLFRSPAILPILIMVSIGMYPSAAVTVTPVNPMPDLIVRNMEFFPTSTGEFPQLGIRVYVKNIGTKKAEGKIVVKLFKTNNATPIEFDAIYPVSAVTNLINAGEEKTFEWKNVGTVGIWAGYFLAVVDIPTKEYPMGGVKEGPAITAEKNNTLAIPFPVK